MKSLSPKAALARLARSTRAGSEAGGRSPGHSTPRPDRGSDSRPRTKSDSGVPDLSGVDVRELVTALNVLIVGEPPISHHSVRTPLTVVRFLSPVVSVPLTSSDRGGTQEGT